METQQLTAGEALARLKDGNGRFVADELTRDLQDAARRVALKDGQAPWAIVLSCADSRVVPELIFDTGIGELFIIRVAGNIANTSSLASIEYAVAHLNVKLIVVLGHEGCGAVKATLDGGDLGYNLNHLVSHITPAIVQPFETDDHLTEAVERNAAATTGQLRERSAIVRDSDGLQIIPAVYRLSTGTVDFLD
ncbi:MAG: carbonic anhydrase [Planctomycetaceae bacterium]